MDVEQEERLLIDSAHASNAKQRIMKLHPEAEATPITSVQEQVIHCNSMCSRIYSGIWE